MGIFKIQSPAEQMSALTSSSSHSASAALRALLALDFAFQHADNPEFASQSGNHRGGLAARLQDLSPAAFRLRREHDEMVLARASNIDALALDSDADRLHLRLFVADVRCELDAFALGCHLTPINSIGYGGVVNNVLEALDWNEDAAANRANLVARILRVEAFPRQCRQYIELLRHGAARGVLASKAMVRKAADQIRDIADDEAKAAPLDVSRAGSEGDDDTALRERMVLANAAFRDACMSVEQFVRHEYAPKCRDACGCAGMQWPTLDEEKTEEAVVYRQGLGITEARKEQTETRGAAVYALSLRYHTTTTMSAEEIHAVGLSEVERIEQRYRDDVLVPLGYLEADAASPADAAFDQTLCRKAFDAFVAAARVDPEQYYSTKEALLEGYATLTAAIRAKLPEFFDSMPSSPLEILEKDAESAPAAYYLAGTPDGRRPGRFYVNVSNLSQRPKYEMTALALHEGIPGHHHQCAIALENDSIPSFLRYLEDRRYEFCPARRQLYAAYLEGWALYCEALGEEMGLYGGDPMKIFGRLSMEMMRAVRLVVDTGIHHQGWSVDKAIAYMMDKTGMHRHECEAECFRYEAWPGQACAYKIGEVAIWKMRREAEAALGERFDLRQFHEVLLGSGPLPLDALEAMVKEWARKLGEERGAGGAGAGK